MALPEKFIGELVCVLFLHSLQAEIFLIRQCARASAILHTSGL